jgi:hypothetical protein
MSQFSKHCVRLGATTALAAFLSAGLSLPSLAAGGVWKVDVSKSTFSAGSNTLVLQHYDGSAAGQQTEGAGNTFLVVSNGKIYVATNDAAYGASSNGLRSIDYSHWRDMKLIEIGNNVHSADTCNFRCQQGLPDPRMTLTFKATNGNPRDQMNEIVVLNR